MKTAQFEIEIKNFLRVRQATIPLGGTPVAVIAENASGKTSAAVAMAGILGRNTNPLGLGKSKRPYLNDAADSGEVVMRGAAAGEEYRRWTLQDQNMMILDDAADTSGDVLGLTDFLALSPQDRVKTWEGCFLPDGKTLVEMVGTNLRDQIARKAMVDEVLEMLKVKKWPEVEAVFGHKMTEAKRTWERISGEKYGTVKADRWNPPAWKSALDTVTPAEASTRLEEAKEAHRMAHAMQAVSESDMARASEATAKIPQLERELDAQERESESAIDDLGLLVREAREELATVRSAFQTIQQDGRKVRAELDQHLEQKPQAQLTTPCPLCHEKLIITNNRELFPATDEKAFSNQVTLWNIRKQDLETELMHMRQRAGECKIKEVTPREREHEAREANLLKHERASAAAIATIRARLDSARAVADTYEGASVLTEDDLRKQAILEQAVDDARADAEMVEQRRGAVEAHENAINYGLIKAALGPKGIRASAMAGKIKELHALLPQLSELSGWPEVKLDSAYNVLVDGYYSQVTARSWRWRANVLLQAAIAVLTEEEYLIADGADVLDHHDGGIAGLVSLCDWLSHRGIFPIVCATDTITGLPSDWQVVKL